MTKKYDALIIGGGHNGLVCAFYLARAGLKVRVLERRHIVGGAAVTEEFHPGFRNSTASYTVSLLRPKVIADMRLHERGWRIIERTISNFFPHEDGYLKLGGGTARTQAEFARFSKRMPTPSRATRKRSNASPRCCATWRSRPRPTPAADLRALLAAAAQGKRLAGMQIEAQRDVMDLFVKSARDFLEGWYENPYIQAAFGFDAVVGNYASPDTPGRRYVLLHHVFGEINGKKGMWGHSVGGMGAITQYHGRGVHRHGSRDQPRGAGRKRAGRRRQGRGRDAGERRGDRRGCRRLERGPGSALPPTRRPRRPARPNSRTASTASRPGRAPSG